MILVCVSVESINILCFKAQYLIEKQNAHNIPGKKNQKQKPYWGLTLLAYIFFKKLLSSFHWQLIQLSFFPQ